MTAVAFALWTLFAFGISWLVSRSDKKRERTESFAWLFGGLMALAVIVVLGKYFWPGPRNPEDDYH